MDKLTITKIDVEYKNGLYSRIVLKRGKQELNIDFSGALDLHFALKNCKENNTFIIGKDNYGVWLLFDKLYNEVMSGQVFNPITDLDINMLIDECELFDVDYHNALKERYERYETIKKEDLQNGIRTGLIVDDKIIWRDDDFDIDVAPYLMIEKINDIYKLTFDVPEFKRELDTFEEHLLCNKDTISIRIRNSGSRYYSFNSVFMRLYRSLVDLATDIPQISIDEYLIDKELERGMKLERILK
ncbi:MAG: hypothetical protein E7163_02980 [Firmicutes bacterium]|nr:hypothetical protein [Bacillota bacterium]